ncbi:MAG TPA: metal ABC transporter permease [Vicinamibacterales bacterium]|nr:metal ABC transporter permease [Vicinamibacterales bacterium]
MTSDAFVLSIAMAVAAGLVGCFAVMRRMALAGDALSHVALPGIGIALALHVHPVFGAATALFFGALLVWALEERTRLATETTVGGVFSVALAIGSMLTSGEDLIDALFGGAGILSRSEIVFGMIAAVAVIAFMLSQRSRLIVVLVSPDVARTAGINVRRLNLLYLQTFALTIALGLRYLGVLLMGALVVIPAATAKRIASDLNGMLAAAVLVAVIATVTGSYLATWLHRDSGPLIVTMAAVCFVASLLRRGSA